MCNSSCTECNHKVFSSGVSVVDVDGVSTLVINIPTQSFRNGDKGCLVITQTIPTTVTIATPVAISIGDLPTTYNLVACDCSQVTACMLRTRTRYPFRVSTNLTGGVFKILRNLSCAPCCNLTEIPNATTTTGG